MKFFKKFLCILLAAVLISLSPMLDYLNINNIETVEASSVIGTAALLELLLAGYGVTVAGTALNGIVNTFDDWIHDNGSDSSVEAWENASLSNYVMIVPELVSCVGDWLLTKFGSLNSGSVCSTSNVSAIFYGETLSADQQYALSCALSRCGHGPFYFVQVSQSASYAPIHVYLFDFSSNFIVVRYDGKICLYSLEDGYLTLQEFSSSLHSYSCTYYTSNGSFTVSEDEKFTTLSYKSYRSYLISCPFVYVANGDSPSGLYFSDLIDVSSWSYNLNLINDAYVSFGGYSSLNIADLSGLIVTPAIISSIMSAVKGAVASNKTEDEDGNIIWSDAIAQAISDAYAAGLADAKAQQGELEDDLKEEERTSAVTGWLSKIYDAVLSIPSVIIQGFDILSDVFETTVDIKDLITVIPSTIIDGFKEVFPTADTVIELITSIPANIVNALSEVFPVADDLREWITSIPASIVDALSVGIGVIEDGLTAVKEAVLSIPVTVADAITLALEGLFVPDLSLVEEEIADISDSFSWVPDLNNLINDFMLKLEAGDPPTLYLDFTKAEDSKYHGAGLCLAIDFSWYGKYKAKGDLIVGAFLWVIYFWYLFKRVPDIISGAGFITRDFDERNIRNNKKDGD